MLTKDEFNILCTNVMGYTPFDLDLHYDRDYNPYDDLNHIAEVVEKLAVRQHQKFDDYVCPLTIAGQGIKVSMRDFIIAAADESCFA